MTLEQIDALLAQWHANLDAADANLNEITSLLTYKLLVGDTSQNRPPAQLKGTSKTEVEKALADIQMCESNIPLMRKVLDAADAKRKEVPRFLQHDKLLEIEQLLTGKSVELPSVSKSLAERGLLSASTITQYTDLKSLLDSMVPAFDKAKAIILKVQSVWHNQTNAVSQAEAELKELEALAASVGASELPELTAARANLQRWRNDWQSDPLSVGNDLDGLKQLRARLESFRQEKQAVDSSLARAHEQLMQLKLGNADTAKVASLERWLQQIEESLRQGNIDRVKNGLVNWFKNAAAAAQGQPLPGAPSGPTTPVKNTPTLPSVPGTPPPPAPPPEDSRLGSLINSGPVEPKPPVTPGSKQQAGTSTDPALDDLISGHPAAKKDQPQPGAPADPRLEQVLTEPAKKKPADTGTGSGEEAALGDLLSGKPAGKAKPPAATSQTPQGGDVTALEDVLSGKPARRQQTTTTGGATPPSKPDDGAAVGDLIEGRKTAKGKPPEPPKGGDGGAKKLEDLFKK